MVYRSLRSLGALLLGLLPAAAHAQPTVTQPVFNGGGIDVGLNQAQNIQSISDQPLRELVIDIMIQVLNYLALAATVVIVSAGIWLILGFGEESARERAQRMIIYTVIGLAIVFVARVIVAGVQQILSGS